MFGSKLTKGPKHERQNRLRLPVFDKFYGLDLQTLIATIHLFCV